AAFARAMTEMPPIPKTAKASRGNAGTFWYAPLEVILGKAQPVLGRHGLHLGFNEVKADDPKKVAVVAVVRHEGGHSTTSSPADSLIISFSNANNPLQNREGTLTGLKRSLAATVLGLAIGGEEEAALASPAPQEPPRPVVNVEPVLDRIYAAKSVEELQAIKPDIVALPAGPERSGVVAAAAQRLQQIEATDASN
ncbi:MAG: ERF family protein, partial [Pseudomonadota bacterium]